MEDTFYVYAHYEDDILVYIGKGQGGRVLSTNARLNKPHRQFMMSQIHNGNIAFAKILKTGLHEQEALSVERAMIKEHQPKFNRRYTEKQAVKAKEIAMNASRASMKPVQTPAGVFESARAAARYYGVTSGAIWHRIKDNPDEYYYIKDKT